jgi:hypothetical protein
MKTILSKCATVLRLAAPRRVAFIDRRKRFAERIRWRKRMYDKYSPLVNALRAELERNPAMPQTQQVEFLRKRFSIGSTTAKTFVTYTHL